MFYDTDFYQQLLRSVIDAREGAGTGAADWMALQKQKKARKAVDTKASKGRKLRWVSLLPPLPPLFLLRGRAGGGYLFFFCCKWFFLVRC